MHRQQHPRFVFHLGKPKTRAKNSQSPRTSTSTAFTANCLPTCLALCRSVFLCQFCPSWRSAGQVPFAQWPKLHCNTSKISSQVSSQHCFFDMPTNGMRTFLFAPVWPGNEMARVSIDSDLSQFTGTPSPHNPSVAKVWPALLSHSCR